MRHATEILCPCGAPCGREYPDRISHLDGGEPGYREGIGENYLVAGVWHCSPMCAITSVDTHIDQWKSLRDDWALDDTLERFKQAENELFCLYALRVRFWEEQNRVSPQNASESRQNRL